VEELLTYAKSYKEVIALFFAVLVTILSFKDKLLSFGSKKWDQDYKEIEIVKEFLEAFKKQENELTLSRYYKLIFNVKACFNRNEMFFCILQDRPELIVQKFNKAKKYIEVKEEDKKIYAIYKTKYKEGWRRILSKVKAFSMYLFFISAALYFPALFLNDSNDIAFLNEIASLGIFLVFGSISILYLMEYVYLEYADELVKLEGISLNSLEDGIT